MGRKVAATLQYLSVESSMARRTASAIDTLARDNVANFHAAKTARVLFSPFAANFNVVLRHLLPLLF